MNKYKDMSFLDHLEELRWHIIRSTFAVLIVAAALFDDPPSDDGSPAVAVAVAVSDNLRFLALSVSILCSCW